MRPHVELIQEADLCWHDAELVRGDGKAKQQANDERSFPVIFQPVAKCANACEYHGGKKQADERPFAASKNEAQQNDCHDTTAGEEIAEACWVGAAICELLC